MTESILELRSVSRVYRMAKTEVPVLESIDLNIDRGQLVGLVGPSGSGKSTLLHTAGLLERPQSGEVWVNGRNCSDLGDKDRTFVRRSELGFVYQFHHLLPEFTAIDNVATPLFLSGWNRKKARERAAFLLEQLGLADRLNHQPMELSGGEQQRVAIARALSNSPRLLIADEPTGNLDKVTTERVFEQLIKLGREEGLCMLIATHNLELTKHMDAVFTIEDKRLTEYSS